MDRLAKELEMVQHHYPGAGLGPNQDWLLIPEFELPPGYSRRRTRLLVLIPPGYPVTPPDNFYVDTGLRLSDGTIPSSYSDNVSQIGETWGQFSWHAEGGHWRPTPRPEEGHNLVSFLRTVRQRLAEP